MYVSQLFRIHIEISFLLFSRLRFWQILYTLVFFVIMFLWRPLKNFKDYAYMQELETQDQIDEEFEEEFGPDVKKVSDCSCNVKEVETVDDEVEAKFTIEEDEIDTKVN